MNKTKIDWCEYTWNPVTGCLHGCKYCYAKRIADRFGGESHANKVYATENCGLKLYESNGFGFYQNHRIEEKVSNKDGRIVTYPFGFKPTFHRYRLAEPQEVKKPSRIFVVSMGDLFGSWVPEEWITEVFEACKKAPQHTYLFLTKNPTRYAELADRGKLPSRSNFWYGSTITGNGERRFVSPKTDRDGFNTFLSIEPLLKTWEFNPYGEFDSIKWAIIGAQTGPGSIAPKPEWVQAIIDECRKENVPIWLKDNLKWPEKIQELPGVQP